MNGSDGVDLAIDLLPRRVVRMCAIILCAGIALHVPEASRLLLWYANDKAQGIVKSVMDSVESHAPEPAPSD